MADKTAVNLRNDVLQTTGDLKQTRFKDPLIVVYAMEGLRLILQEIQRQNKFGTIPEQTGKDVIPYAEFSGLNKHDLQLDFFTKIRGNRYGYSKPFRITTPSHIEDDTSTNYAIIDAATVGAPVPNSANTGIDDLDTRGKFTGTSNDTYTITIASSTTFNWSSSAGGSGSGVTMTGGWQTLDNGVQVWFETKTGYTAGDSWTFVAYYDQIINIITLNWNPAENIILRYVQKIVDITLTNDVIDANQFIPFYRYYDVLKDFVTMKLNNHAERNIQQDLLIDNQVITKISNVASTINSDDDLSIRPNFVSKDFI